MHIDFCASAWAVHVHYQVMKAVFCWPWNENNQIAKSKEGIKTTSFCGGLSAEPGASGCDC